MNKGRKDMFRVKICGITSVEDARTVVEAGADAVGLNFYAKSPRYLQPAVAEAVAAAFPREIVKVGLFVNAVADEICARFERLGLDLIQLHGDEPPEFVARLGGRPVMRAFRVGDEGLGPVYEYIERTEQLGCPLRAVLVDSYRKGRYGGTGQVADWATVAAYEADPPLVLAGGLTPENVGEAVAAVRPTAVDTASGVESSPGKKDPAAVRAFVRAARAALDLEA